MPSTAILPTQLVDVDQAVAEQRLRQESRGRGCRARCRSPATRRRKSRQHVGERQRRRDEAAERKIADARALHALGGRTILRVEVPHAAVQPAEHVDAERQQEVAGVVERLPDRRVDQRGVREHRPRERDARSAFRAADRRLRQEDPEEPDRGRRDCRGGPQRQPAHHRRAGRGIDERAQVPRRLP